MSVYYVETEQLIRSAGTCQPAAAILDAVEKWSETYKYILHVPRKTQQHVMQQRNGAGFYHIHDIVKMVQYFWVMWG